MPITDTQRAKIAKLLGMAENDRQFKIVEDAARAIGATDQDLMASDTRKASGMMPGPPFLSGASFATKMPQSSMRLTAQTGRAAGPRMLPPKSGLGKMPQDLPPSPGTVAANAPRRLTAGSGRTQTPISPRTGVGGPEGRAAVPSSGRSYPVRPLGGGVTTPASVRPAGGAIQPTPNLPSALNRLRDVGQAPARSVAESASTLRTGAAVAGKSFGRGTQFFDDAGRAFEVTAKPFKGKFTAKSLETGEIRQFSAFKPYRTLKATPTAQAGSEVLPENVFAP